jgi:aerobic carbon-monoxide dehydrogenase medium subunit
VIPTTFDYQRATSLDDALAKMRAAGGDAKLLAGGHSLIPLMKLRMSEPGLLIDIARIPELAGIREQDGKIEIGAATVHHAVATSSLLLDRCRVVAEAAATIGDPQVRNRGTIGGSLAHADPSADYPAVMLALDADIHLKSANGARVVKVSDFFMDLFTVNLQPDEIITAVQFAPVKAAAYEKLYQKASHYAIVGVAAALDVKDGKIASARIGLTGATTHAVRLTKVEQALAGQAASKDAIEKAAAGAGAELTDLNADIHASAEYRKAMIAVFTKRALLAALARRT